MKYNNKIFVTSPLLPSIEDFTEQIKEIYDSKWLTIWEVSIKLLKKL